MAVLRVAEAGEKDSLYEQRRLGIRCHGVVEIANPPAQRRRETGKNGRRADHKPGDGHANIDEKAECPQRRRLPGPLLCGTEQSAVRNVLPPAVSPSILTAV